MEYGGRGSNSIFLRIFFDKKYGLPYWVVDTVVFQFLEISRGNQIPSCSMASSFSDFCSKIQSTEQKEALLELIKWQFHNKIMPEIRRELQHAKCWDEEIEEPMLWKKIWFDESYVWILYKYTEKWYFVTKIVLIQAVKGQNNIW